MRWQGRRDSDDAGDRSYDEVGNNDGPGGSGTRFPVGGTGIIAILAIIGIAVLLGVDPRAILWRAGSAIQL